MIGPSISANGGIASVVKEYYKAHIDEKCNLLYLSSTNSENFIRKNLCFIKACLIAPQKLKECDIVHIHMSKSGSFFRKKFFVKKAKKYEKPVIIHIHSSQFNDFYEKSSPFVKKQIIGTFEKADRIIVLSDYWKKEYSHFSKPEKMIVIENGVVIPKKFEKDYNKPSIIFLGKICKEKGIYDLLKAVSILKNQFPEIKLKICGLGEIDNCKEICKKYRIEQNVDFLGWVLGEEKRHLLEESAIFVLPSYYEGMPVSLIEAMSYGCCCVSSNVGGIPDVLNDKCGIMFNSGKVEELVDSLTEVLKSEAIREKLGKEAYLIVQKRFDESLVIDKIISIYKEVLNGNKNKT